MPGRLLIDFMLGARKEKMEQNRGVPDPLKLSVLPSGARI